MEIYNLYTKKSYKTSDTFMIPEHHVHNKTIFQFPLWSSELWLNLFQWVGTIILGKHTGYTLRQKKCWSNTFLSSTGKHTPATWCHEPRRPESEP